MVPGALIMVIPFLDARPLRGRIWASKPGGTAIAKPQGISLISPRFTAVGPVTAACRSKPAACSVMRRGSGTSTASGRRWTFIVIGRGTRSAPEMAGVTKCYILLQNVTLFISFIVLLLLT